jgi:hypothetical protein
LAVTAQQLFGLQPALVVHRQIDKVGKGVRFQHLAQLKQLFGVALNQISSCSTDRAGRCRSGCNG